MIAVQTSQKLMISGFCRGETFLKTQNEPVNESAQQMNWKKGANTEYLFRFQSKKQRKKLS